MSSLSRIIPILAVAAAVLLAGCGGDGESTQTTAAERPALDASKTYTVTLETTKGTFEIALDVERSPKTTASFAALVEQGFFDGTVFHRIVPGFVIQGGDPTGTGTGGPGYTTVDVPPVDSAYTKGVVAMAKAPSEPTGTAGSQFFVVTSDEVFLPPEYALLAKVTSGLDVVEKIGRLGDPATEQPTERVEIEQATLTER
jgi:cyclophilin family peptidyl-prolyl cis-trans isomerase